MIQDSRKMGGAAVVERMIKLAQSLREDDRLKHIPGGKG